MAEYITIDVYCVSCRKPVKPNEIEFELFRLGFPVHLQSIDSNCMVELEKELKEKGLIPS